MIGQWPNSEWPPSRSSIWRWHPDPGGTRGPSLPRWGICADTLSQKSRLCLCGEFFGCTPTHDHYRIRRCGSCEWRERWVGCVVWRLLDQAGTIMIFGIANVSMKHDVAVCLQIRCWLCTDCAWSRAPKVIVHFRSFCRSDPTLALKSPRSRSFLASADFSVQLLVTAVFNVFRRAQSGDIDTEEVDKANCM